MGGGVNVIMTQPIGLPILQFDVQIYIFFFVVPTAIKMFTTYIIVSFPYL